MAILKNIQWTFDDPNAIIQKVDLGGNQVNKGSVLTVKEGQAAIFIYKGKLADVYLPGFYKLDTDNMPVLTKLMSWKYGFETPFVADIYFVSTRQFTNRKWGTANPIIVRDQEYGAVRIRSYGTYSFRVDDPYIFMKNVTGSCSYYSTDEINNYLRSMVVAGISDALGESKLSILDLAGNMLEMGNIVEEKLGATFKEISIKDACIQHFKDIEHNIDTHDITFENSQARERTQILMDYANKTGALHLGTGDMSELALGWATYNGDHISMYNVNGSIPKTLAKYMVAWVALRNEGEIRSTLLDVVNTPISPELTPADENGNIKQKTEDIVGPYELHDFFLYNFLRYGFSVSKIFFLAKTAFDGKYDNECIKKWLTTFVRRFFQQQFKRSCLNDGPAVGIISLSPRGGLVMPSDMSATVWLSECEKL